MFLLAALSLAGCGGGSTPGGSDSSAVFDSPRNVVPLTFFDTEHHSACFHFDMASLRGGLLIDNSVRLALPEKTLPLKVIEWGGDSLIVFTRDLFSSRIRIWEAKWKEGRFLEIGVPASLRQNLFRQASAFGRHVVFVLFEPLENANHVYRLVPGPANGPALAFDESFKKEFRIARQLYQQQPHVLALAHGERLFLFADSAVAAYGCDPDGTGAAEYEVFSLSDSLIVLEVASDGHSLYGLYKNIDYDPSAEPAPGGGLFALVDISSREDVGMTFDGGIPYGLEVVGGAPSFSLVGDARDLVEVFLLDMSNMPCSGLMSAGTNNVEGEVVWSQSYYLGAFVDLLSRDAGPGLPEAMAPLISLVKTRLDFEMLLLDRLMGEEPGLYCRIFAVGREPLLHAVQTGKMLLLLKRYLMEVPRPASLGNYAAFREATMGLDNHVEVLVRSAPDDPWLGEERHYLMWPKGAPFWADGVGLPYNHQNCWAAGVLYGEDVSDLDPGIVRAARDIGTQVFDYEGFLDDPPKHDLRFAASPDYFQWHYWWGQGRAGWDAEDGVSINTPVRGRQDTMALKVYLTFDAVAMLLVEEKFPATLPPAFLQYLRSGVERDGFDLFLANYLDRVGEMPGIGSGLAAKYLRSASPPEIRNAAWAYIRLGQP